MKFDRIIISKFKDGAYIDFMYNNKTEYLTLNLYSHLKLSPTSVINDGIIRIINKKELYYES